ncbi:uncharacterized protein LOC128728577 [Anopheles nili]|uniref:uncharacterized protein LOC128728577 n=1 Tax=Anopheles nili TaxID=185578 RepID=UPI00237ABA80|nr:uncharacterized protein LOC128728577 [Anopheles nili]
MHRSTSHEETEQADLELAVVRVRTLEEPQSPSIRSDGSEGRKSSVYVYGDGHFNITLKHYDSIVSEVKCPGCAEPMDGPITMCNTGHSTCALCRAKLASCPLCGDRLTDLRNYTLEAIVAKVQFPCKNAGKGCAVRLPLQLLRWHRERCDYKLIQCFMGKVWGACGWQGCERDWMAHCLETHADHVYSDPQVTLRWDYGTDVIQRTSELQLVVAYHLLRVFDESFNLYQVYDQDSRTVVWTMICATKESKVSARFTFELELFSPVDNWKLLVQRFPCHSELDPEFLHDGHCAKINLADVQRFMTEDKVLHYRVRVLEVGPSRCQSLAKLSTTDGVPSAITEAPSHLPTDYNCKHIEHVNMKAVPEGNIICRKQQNSSASADNDNDDVFLPYIDASVDANLPQSRKSTPARSVSISKPTTETCDGVQEAVELQPIQKLVRVRVAEREEPVKMQAQYVSRKTPVSGNGDVNRQVSTESLAKPAKGSGLSKFYNITMYKAAKFLDKKSIK